MPAAIQRAVTKDTVCGISTLDGLVAVQETRTQDSSTDFSNEKHVARRFQSCMNFVFRTAR